MNFKIERATPDNIVSAHAKAAMSYWMDLRGNAALPMWTAFDIVAVPTIVPHSMSIKISMSGGKPEFDYNMTGTRMVASMGDLTGKSLNSDAVRSGTSDRLVERGTQLFETAVRTREATVATGPNSIPAEDTTRHETLVLPFADETGLVTHLVVVVTYS